MTNSTAGVRLGGGGYSYGDYALPTDGKKPAPLHDEEGSSKKRATLINPKKKSLLEELNNEVFLFTIRDPMKTVISQLMDLMSVYANEPIPEIDIELAETGPLGYTTIHGWGPTAKRNPLELLKPTVR